MFKTHQNKSKLQKIGDLEVQVVVEEALPAGRQQSICLRETAKKRSFLNIMGVQVHIKALIPSPLELNGSRNFAVGKKKF